LSTLIRPICTADDFFKLVTFELDAMQILCGSMDNKSEMYIEIMVPTAMVMKSSIFWDTSNCIALKVPPKHRLTFYGLHGVKSQNIELFNSEISHR
jgi:hypothetical protein